jgi:hypothetical protein
MPIPEPVRYRYEETQSGIGTLQYRTEMMDAGIGLDADVQLWRHVRRVL